MEKKVQTWAIPTRYQRSEDEAIADKVQVDAIMPIKALEALELK